MTKKLKSVLLVMGVFGTVFLAFCALLYINAYFFTPMPDSDADLAAWGMRYALIPGLSFIYATIVFLLIGFVRLISFIKGRSGTKSD